MDKNKSNSEIELLKRLVKFQLVEVVTNVNLDPIKTATFSLDRKIRDSKIKVPLWLAEELLKDGKVRVSESLFSWLNQVLWKEKAKFDKKGASISKQDDKFYPNIFLIEAALKYDKTLGFDENTITNVKNLIRLIINKRVEAIVRMAESGDTRLFDKLTPEEKVLYKNIRNILENWMEFTGVEEL
ncbi:hypothetical protein DRN84_00145 [Candidatus Geothermarchaeota archaeon]|nr:MAG: hypothetical protein DRN87_01490 [Candidatus Geothermarchaeota archaeon]RLG63095.1 MAG: hypothetical protein DRN84_00145 [Candidatus Geothermarchaeota archaeon]HEW93397.1 DNA replication complex GINS family protein [Thermoprotei archaeon]